jgi:hypothetical protein
LNGELVTTPIVSDSNEQPAVRLVAALSLFLPYFLI